MPAIPPVKGTRDFYPEEMAFQRWLYQRIREVSESFGYQEYDGPFLERLELYAARSGEELVKEQAYVFPDRGGDMIVLRPELTPSLARMVAARSKALPWPIRWWSFGPFWRYERPQKGRSREFFQWNIDLLGIDTPLADAEIAAIAATFFRAVGLGPERVRIFINNRRLAEEQLSSIGIAPGMFPTLFRLIDRKDKLQEQAWRDYARELGVTEDQLERLESDLADRQVWRRSTDVCQFLEAVQVLGVGDYFAYEPTVIRGLDYYTGTVFEARDSAGEKRAILGGGRYDNLVADVGGEALPGVGFAMGDKVIRLVLEEAGTMPTLAPHPAALLVTTFDEESRVHALALASTLRKTGIRVSWYPLADRLQKQLKYADRLGIGWVAILGPDEIRQQMVTLKDLKTGEQITLPNADVPEKLPLLLERA